MIAKSDLIILLTEMQNNGEDVYEDIQKVLSSDSIPIDIMKRINDYRTLDIVNFYTKLRSSYNNKKSKLYINIMRADENVIEDPKTIVTTLSALLNQILQFKASDPVSFYQHSRCNEILAAFKVYFETFNLDLALQLLKMFKADILVLEVVTGKRSI